MLRHLMVQRTSFDSIDIFSNRKVVDLTMENHQNAPSEMHGKQSQLSVSLCGQLGVKKNFLQRAFGKDWNSDKIKGCHNYSTTITVSKPRLCESPLKKTVHTSRIPEPNENLYQNKGTWPSSHSIIQCRGNNENIGHRSKTSDSDFAKVVVARQENKIHFDPEDSSCTQMLPKVGTPSYQISRSRSNECPISRSALTPQKNQCNASNYIDTKPTPSTPLSQRLENTSHSENKKFDNSIVLCKELSSAKRRIFSHNDKENRPPRQETKSPLSKSKKEKNVISPWKVVPSSPRSKSKSMTVHSTAPINESLKNNSSSNENISVRQLHFLPLKSKQTLTPDPSPSVTTSHNVQDIDVKVQITKPKQDFLISSVHQTLMTKAGQDLKCFATPSCKQSPIAVKPISDTIPLNLHKNIDIKYSRIVTPTNEKCIKLEEDSGIANDANDDMSSSFLRDEQSFSQTTRDPDIESECDNLPVIPNSNNIKTDISVNNPGSSKPEHRSKMASFNPNLLHSSPITVPYAYPHLVATPPENAPLLDLRHLHNPPRTASAGTSVPPAFDPTTPYALSHAIATGAEQPFGSPYLNLMARPLDVSTPRTSAQLVNHQWMQEVISRIAPINPASAATASVIKHLTLTTYPMLPPTQTPPPVNFNTRPTFPPPFFPPGQVVTPFLHPSQMSLHDSGIQNHPMDLSGSNHEESEASRGNHCRKSLFSTDMTNLSELFKRPSNEAGSDDSAYKSDKSLERNSPKDKPGQVLTTRCKNQAKSFVKENNPFGIDRILGVPQSPIKAEPDEESIKMASSRRNKRRFSETDQENGEEPKPKKKSRDKPPQWGVEMASLDIHFDESEERTRFCDENLNYKTPEVPEDFQAQDDLRLELLRLFKKSNLPPVPDQLKENLIALRYFPHMNTLIQAHKMIDIQNLNISPGGLAFENFQMKETNEFIDLMLTKQGEEYRCLGRKCIDPSDAICNFTAKTLGKMRRHVKNHLPDKKWVCCFCRSQMTDQTDMSRHGTTHTGLRPFFCVPCKKPFTQKVTMVNHMETHHSIVYKEEPTKNRYTCRPCGVHFNKHQRDECQKHLFTFHRNSAYASLKSRNRFPFNSEEED